MDDFSDSMSEKSIAEGDVYVKKRKKYKLPPIGKNVPPAYKKQEYQNVFVYDTSTAQFKNPSPRKESLADFVSFAAPGEVSVD